MLETEAEKGHQSESITTVNVITLDQLGHLKQQNEVKTEAEKGHQWEGITAMNVITLDQL
jgi:hypothetical protein